MIALFAALVVGSADNLDEKSQGEIRAAIWGDLQLNAMIGNGNWSGSLWYNAGGSNEPNLHIQALDCAHRGRGYRCSFVLFRDGGPAVALGQPAPDRLTCQADLERDQDRADGLRVSHRPPPPRGGHSLTSMVCRE